MRGTITLGLRTLSFGGNTASPHLGISPKEVANYVHAVMETDREISTTQVVERMQENGITFVAEQWEPRNALP